MPEPPLTLPDHGGSTTVAPTSLGELPPDLLADAAFPVRYQDRAPLGEGGMGIVRAALDRRIGREVALKIVRPGEGSRGDLKARFLREACVQGQLEHPAIVPVYDLGRDPEGTLYFTMKRVRGQTFERIIDALRAGDAEATRTYTRHKVLSAFASVCHAVAFAHARGVVHRDLKPANVMLGDYGEVYVLDWGLAKVVGAQEPRLSTDPPAIESGSDPGARTKAGATMGTPGYMAPEQVRGEEVDARADVYALGAILFELLALEPLHPHGTAAEATGSTLRGIDARPSVRAPDRDVAPELDAICAQATATDVPARTPSVKAMVEAIERFLEGDRDLARRRALAEEHTRRAAVLAETALTGDGGATETRALALREIGRAIALDPTDERAVRTLMRLMTDPPRAVPAEAAREMGRRARRGMRDGAKMAALGYLVWFLYSPLMLWTGVRSWTLWLVSSAAWLVASACAYRAWRRPAPDGAPPYGMILSGVVAVATTTGAFGPFVILPTMAAVGAMLMQMPPAPRRRTPTAALYALALAVPSVLAWAGVLPSQYTFEGGNLVVHPVMLEFRAVPTYALIFLTDLGLVLGGSLLLGRFRDTLGSYEERLSVQTWQLRQLMPDEARPASLAHAPESLAVLPDSVPPPSSGTP